MELCVRHPAGGFGQSLAFYEIFTTKLGPKGAHRHHNEGWLSIAM
jgi:hypothetical protein